MLVDYGVCYRGLEILAAHFHYRRKILVGQGLSLLIGAAQITLTLGLAANPNPQPQGHSAPLSRPQAHLTHLQSSLGLYLSYKISDSMVWSFRSAI